MKNDASLTSDIQAISINQKEQQEEFLQELLRAIRSSLTVVGTSFYLLEDALNTEDVAVQKYFQNISKELEHLRKLINY